MRPPIVPDTRFACSSCKYWGDERLSIDIDPTSVYARCRFPAPVQGVPINVLVPAQAGQEAYSVAAFGGAWYWTAAQDWCGQWTSGPHITAQVPPPAAVLAPTQPKRRLFRALQKP
jgi:hypothetical protein